MEDFSIKTDTLLEFTDKELFLILHLYREANGVSVSKYKGDKYMCAIMKWPIGRLQTTKAILVSRGILKFKWDKNPDNQRFTELKCTITCTPDLIW